MQEPTEVHPGVPQGGTQGVAQGHAAAAAEPRSAEVVRSEERLRVGVERVVTKRIRVAKRVVTEMRQITVPVRREELVVEELPADGGGATAGPREFELVLREEQPVVTTQVVAVERVRVSTRRVTEERAVEEVVRREVVEVETPETARPAP